MGYYSDITETDFVIPAEQADAARDAFLLHADIAHGDVTGLDTTDLPEVLERFWFGTHVRDNGDIAITTGQSKYRFQMRLLNALAPFLREGAYAIWRGEEGELSRQVVVGGQMVEQQGRVTFV